jgi:hypothetical protein
MRLNRMIYGKSKIMHNNKKEVLLDILLSKSQRYMSITDMSEKDKRSIYFLYHSLCTYFWSYSDAADHFENGVLIRCDIRAKTVERSRIEYLI